MPHPDVLEQAINYQVPVDRYDELARYDGSVIAECTKGQLSARCDKEGANFLAINLANDVAMGKRTVDDARAYYARAIQTFSRRTAWTRTCRGFNSNHPHKQVMRTALLSEKEKRGRDPPRLALRPPIGDEIRHFALERSARLTRTSSKHLLPPLLRCGN